MNTTDITSPAPTFRAANPNLTAALGFGKFLVKAALVTITLMFIAGGILVGLGVDTTTPAPTPSTPAASAPTNTSAKACWDEPNSAMDDGLEHICGDVTTAPVTAIHFTDWPIGAEGTNPR